MIKLFLINIFLTALAAYLTVFLYIVTNQRKLLYLPRKDKIYNTPASMGIKYENHHIDIDAHESIHLWLIPEEKQTKTTLIYFHGNTGNLEDRLKLIPVLKRLNMNLVFFDYRGYGESIGEPSEKNLYQDAEAAINFIKRRLQIQDTDLIFLGKSLGVAVAIEAANRHPNIRALIIDSTFTSLPNIAFERYPFIPCHLVAIDRFENLKKIPNIHCPKLFLHSKQDTVINYKHTLRLFNHAKDPKKLLLFENGSHDNLLLENEEIYINAIRDLLYNKGI